MRRWLYVHRFVSGDIGRLETALLRETDVLLRGATGSPEGDPAADGSYPLALSTRVGSVEVTKRVRVRTGVAVRSGERVMLPVEWHADPARTAFPSFEGSIELEPLSSYSAQLSLAGSYRPPLGPVGVLADAAVFHRFATSAASGLVTALARMLSNAARDDRPRTGLGNRPRVGEPLRVADVMTADPIVITDDLPLRTAALLLFHNEISGVPVATNSGELVGVLSERDLLAKEAAVRFGFGREAAAEDRRREARTAGEACSRPARVTVPEARLAEVAREMLDHDVSRLVVVDEAKIAGIVSRHDVLAALVREDSEIEYAVQRVVEAAGADEVQVSVQWGEVTLSGRVRQRSVADQLPASVATVDGVMHVEVDELEWVEDDVLPPVPYV